MTFDEFKTHKHINFYEKHYCTTAKIFGFLRKDEMHERYLTRNNGLTLYIKMQNIWMKVSITVFLKSFMK